MVIRLIPDTRCQYNQEQNMKKVPNWKDSPIEALHWDVLDESARTVQCKLSPRNCKIKQGNVGFCGVRGNIDGKLYSYNYGKAVSATLESIETEAVNHFSPGKRILSLGNIGCMLACDFCQNWETSQIKHLDEKHVRKYEPAKII